MPEGTKVTGVPSGCYPHTLDGGYYPRQAGAPRYDCYLPYWVLEYTQRRYAFSLRVDTGVPRATGAVSVHPSAPRRPRAGSCWSSSPDRSSKMTGWRLSRPCWPSAA